MKLRKSERGGVVCGLTIGLYRDSTFRVVRVHDAAIHAVGSVLIQNVSDRFGHMRGGPQTGNMGTDLFAPRFMIAGPSPPSEFDRR